MSYVVAIILIGNDDIFPVDTMTIESDYPFVRHFGYTIIPIVRTD